VDYEFEEPSHHKRRGTVVSDAKASEEKASKKRLSDKSRRSFKDSDENVITESSKTLTKMDSKRLAKTKNPPSIEEKSAATK